MPHSISMQHPIYVRIEQVQIAAYVHSWQSIDDTNNLVEEKSEIIGPTYDTARNSTTLQSLILKNRLWLTIELLNQI